jgi:hypothetical protein
MSTTTPVKWPSTNGAEKLIEFIESPLKARIAELEEEKSFWVDESKRMWDRWQDDRASIKHDWLEGCERLQVIVNNLNRDRKRLIAQCEEQAQVIEVLEAARSRLARPLKESSPVPLDDNGVRVRVGNTISYSGPSYKGTGVVASISPKTFVVDIIDENYQSVCRKKDNTRRLRYVDSYVKVSK